MISTFDYVQCLSCTNFVPSNRSERADSACPGNRVCTDCSYRVNQQTFTLPRFVSPGDSSRLVFAFGFVDFDLQLGPRIEHLYPKIPFSLEQEKEIAFLCFPDANYGAGDDLASHDFIFSINPSEFEITDGDQSEFLSERQDFFATSLFFRIKDSEAERGAFQSAIFCIAFIPLPDATKTLLSAIYDSLTNSREAGCVCVSQLLEEAYREAMRWDFVGEPYHCDSLEFLGKRINIFRPSLLPTDFCSAQWSGEPNSFSLFGPRCVVEDLVEIVESASCEYETARGEAEVARSVWPRILGKLQMLPPLAKKRCLSAISAAMPDWDQSSLTYIPREERVALVEISRSLRIGGSHREPPAEPQAALSIAREMLTLFRNPNFYPKDIVFVQNMHLEHMLARALQVLDGEKRSSTISQPQTSSPSGLCWDSPMPFSEVLSLCDSMWPHTSRIYKLWQLLVSGESILVLAADLSVASQACLAITSLLSPVRFEGVLRPYLTVSNRESERVLSRSPPAVPTVVGVTNPFFVEKCSSWTNILCFGAKSQRPSTTAAMDKYVKNHHGGGKLLANSNAVKTMMQFTLSDAMLSNHSFCVRCEMLASRVPGDTASESVLRKRIRLLTVAFLSPLHDFVVSSLRQSRPFFTRENWQHSLIGPDAIMGELQSTAKLPVELFKSRIDLLKLYRQFIFTPTFRRWRQSLCDAVEREIILSSESIEDLLLLDPSPQSRFQVLTYLQTIMSRCLESKIYDIELIRGLSRILGNTSRLRELLSEIDAHGRRK